MLNTDWYEWRRQGIERHNEQMKKINALALWYQDAETIIADCKDLKSKYDKLEARVTVLEKKFDEVSG